MAEVVRVRLGDETFALRTEKDPVLLLEAAALADARMAELRASVPNRQTAAQLAALALADELLATRRSLSGLRDSLGRGLDAALAQLDDLDAALLALTEPTQGLSGIAVAAADAASLTDARALGDAGALGDAEMRSDAGIWRADGRQGDAGHQGESGHQGARPPSSEAAASSALNSSGRTPGGTL